MLTLSNIFFGGVGGVLNGRDVGSGSIESGDWRKVFLYLDVSAGWELWVGLDREAVVGVLGFWGVWGLSMDCLVIASHSEPFGEGWDVNLINK